MVKQQLPLSMQDNTPTQSEELKNPVKSDPRAIGRIICGRYKILHVLGSGGFSDTYIAEELQFPNKSKCVVKQLKLNNLTQEGLELIKCLFNLEAQTLKKLGQHPQIPKLLGYFAAGAEFYLMQEYIDGHSLSQEIPLGRAITEKAVINILHDILQILVFVHENRIIHRDIKPSNIIRRHSDRKLVLIDFGAVKEVSSQQLENSEQSAFTIGIGTRGYAPDEQYFGRSHYNSDIYAVGMMGIKALTGIAPHELAKGSNGEVQWTDLALVSQPFQAILTQMVLNDARERYQTASEVLADLEQLIAAEYSSSFAELMTWEVGGIEDFDAERSILENTDVTHLNSDTSVDLYKLTPS